MKYIKIIFGFILIIVCVLGTPITNVLAQDAKQLVEESFDYVRGKASISTVNMIVHRPGWQREMTIKAWTRGQKDSLFYIDSPPQGSRQWDLKKGPANVVV